MDYNLDELRANLDRIDKELVRLLSERFSNTQKVGQYKKAHSLTPIDPVREALQFERIEKLALEAGLDPEFAKKFLRLIIDEVVKNHKALQGIDS